LTFLLTPFILHRGKVKKETAMWKGSKTIQDVIQRSRTLFWTFFTSFCINVVKRQQVAVLFPHWFAVREKASKRRRKGEPKISTARFDLF